MANIFGNDDDDAPVAAPKKGSKPAAPAAPAVPEAPKTRPGYVRILLEESDTTPPTGQFFSINGVGYVLRPGEEAEVPEGLVDVLNNAEESIPRLEGDRIVGYKNKLRFPYRLIK